MLLAYGPNRNIGIDIIFMIALSVCCLAGHRCPDIINIIPTQKYHLRTVSFKGDCSRCIWRYWSYVGTDTPFCHKPPNIKVDI